MKTIILTVSLLASFLILPVITSAQYNKCAGVNKIFETRADMEGNIIHDQEGKPKKYEVSPDQFGNAAGAQYDLAENGAFQGSTIAVLHLYTGENFDFHLPKAALAEKGFDIHRWTNAPPPVKELKKVLDKSCQFWLISSSIQMLTEEHAAVIKEFWESGKGVYIWGDNQPYYADANFLGKYLLSVEMQGNLIGNQVVGLDMNEKIGLAPNHLISTGIQQIYEGITIATIQPNQHLQPLIYGSAGNLVTAIYEKDGKRLIFDGGFTRLYCNWNTAGTGRYVKNAAAWLVNFERFGDDILGQK